MSDVLSEKQIDQFITDGFIRINNAFSSDVKAIFLDTLWEDIPFAQFSPDTWTEPVVRLGIYAQRSFEDSVNTPKLHAAFDQLIGAGKWIPCRSGGSFPIQFSSDEKSGDGMHVDASYPGKNPSNYFQWRINIKSKGRALLMLVLYSDVTETDAPTVLYKGSHVDVAKLLSGKGDSGLSFGELSRKLDELPKRKKAFATGKAGTIYLCHPFLAHSTQESKGGATKFMAQPPLLLQTELTIKDSHVGYTPVERAIRLALQ